jgi:hypothetical protein
VSLDIRLDLCHPFSGATMLVFPSSSLDVSEQQRSAPSSPTQSLSLSACTSPLSCCKKAKARTDAQPDSPLPLVLAQPDSPSASTSASVSAADTPASFSSIHHRLSSCPCSSSSSSSSSPVLRAEAGYRNALLTPALLVQRLLELNLRYDEMEMAAKRESTRPLL